jgi:hypothetical protein
MSRKLGSLVPSQTRAHTFNRKTKLELPFVLELKPNSLMKTLFIVILTLMFSQILYLECGPRNPVARVSMAAIDSVRCLLHSVIGVVE